MEWSNRVKYKAPVQTFQASDKPCGHVVRIEKERALKRCIKSKKYREKKWIAAYFRTCE